MTSPDEVKLYAIVKELVKRKKINQMVKENTDEIETLSPEEIMKLRKTALENMPDIDPNNLDEVTTQHLIAFVKNEIL